MDKLILIVLIIIVVGVLVKMVKKKVKTNIIDETIEEDILLAVEPKNLKVFCSTCGNTEVKSGEVLSIKDSGCFSVKGYTLKGEEVRLNGNQLSWQSSCQVVKFQSVTGTTNCISCTNKTDSKRDVWVKYSNWVTFAWKINFGK